MSKHEPIKKCTGCDRLSTDELGLNKYGEPYLACCPDSNYKPITAVDYLLSFIPELGKDLIGRDIIEQAINIERQQIIDAVNVGFEEGCNYPECIIESAEQYYNDKYGK